MTYSFEWKRAVLALFVVACMSTPAFAAGKPLKIFILVGQSNMQGKAQVKTLRGMAMDPKTKPLYDKLVDADGKPKAVKDVHCVYFTKGRKGTIVFKGPLSPSFGGESKPDHTFGPEFAFGATVREHVQGPVLIIKVAWGGKSLDIDFRPPSAGPWKYTPHFDKWMKENAPKKREERIKFNQTIIGKYYKTMLEHINSVLADPGKYHPAYDPKLGYELGGFVWFQGWNDLVMNDTTYNYYTDLLAHFIRDVRSELKTPKLPFVVGVVGFAGPEASNPATETVVYKTKYLFPFRRAQAAVAELPEFKGNVAAVKTAPFWDERLAELDFRYMALVLDPRADKRGKYKELRAKLNPLLDELNAAKKVKGPKGWKARNEVTSRIMQKMYTADELAYRNANHSNAGFHYYGSAKIYSRMGEAFAKAMLEFQQVK